MAGIIRSFAILVLASSWSLALAHHGPGTSGGGSTTQSGETLRPDKLAIDFRLEDTEFERVSDADLLRRAQSAGSFDVLDRAVLGSLSIAYGLCEDFQVGATIGYYKAVGAREAEFDATEGTTELIDFNPNGITDLWLTAKYRLTKGPQGSFAIYGGPKLPTGRSDIRNSAGERIEPSSAPGSGSYDGMLGVAYSRWLSDTITFDSSIQYTLRTEDDHMKTGDRIDVGVAVAYRLSQDLEHYPQWGVFGELNFQQLFKNEEDGAADPNTGGSVLYFSPGVRAQFSPAVAFTLSPQLPILQNTNGEQVDVSWRGVAALTLSF